MNILSWILFGLIVGIIANMLDERSSENSILSAMFIGVGGAVLGGFLANMIFGLSITGFNLTSFLLAVFGALLLLLVRQTIRRT